MKYPVFAIVAFAAVMGVSAAEARDVNHHKPHTAAYEQSVRGAYGMYQSGSSHGSQELPGVWGSGDAAADGNDANSMGGPNSALENPFGP